MGAETAAQKTQAFEKSIDTKKDGGIQLPEKFESTFDGKEKLDNRKKLVKAVNAKFEGMKDEVKRDISIICEQEIKGWKEAPKQGESGKIAVLYLYNALNGRQLNKIYSKENPKKIDEEATYETIINNFTISQNKKIETSEPIKIKIPETTEANNNIQNLNKNIKTELNNLTNPELKKMGEITEINKWMNIPNGIKGWEYAKVDGQMVARMKKPGLLTKGYDYSVFSKEQNKWNEPTPDQNIQIAGITNPELKKMGEIKTEKQWATIPSGQEGWEYTKVDGKMVARTQNPDKSYTYTDFDAKKNEWNTINNPIPEINIAKSAPINASNAQIMGNPIYSKNTSPTADRTGANAFNNAIPTTINGTTDNATLGPVMANKTINNKPATTEVKPVVAEVKPVVAEVKPVVAEVKTVVAEVKLSDNEPIDAKYTKGSNLLPEVTVIGKKIDKSPIKQSVVNPEINLANNEQNKGTIDKGNLGQGAYTDINTLRKSLNPKLDNIGDKADYQEQLSDLAKTATPEQKTILEREFIRTAFFDVFTKDIALWDNGGERKGTLNRGNYEAKYDKTKDQLTIKTVSGKEILYKKNEFLGTA